jgi:hypothetical protein
MIYQSHFGPYDTAGRPYNFGVRPPTVLPCPWFDRNTNRLRRVTFVLVAWCERTRQAWYAPEGEGEIPGMVTWAA